MNSTYETVEKNMAEVFEKARKSSDFITFSAMESDSFLLVSCYRSLIDMELLQQALLAKIKENYHSIQELSDLTRFIPIQEIEITRSGKKMEKSLLEGAVVIQLNSNIEECAIIRLKNALLGIRKTNETENEFSVIGPKIGFIEDLETNLHLMRYQFPTADLIYEQFEVGTRSKTKVVIAYVDGVTNPTYVETARQRIQDLDVDIFFDNVQLEQLISDKTATPFPLYIATERVDRAIAELISGKLAIISDRTCYVTTGPTSFIDFFSSPEDFYLPWIVASFFRLIRLFGVLFSIFSTACYVAILTYHFEMVPKDLLGPIVHSRASVPFPPVVEALFLEITIELLREAGARLPTKIGQTLGIVGGIVIGQASVQAALTSNVLLIIVALSALSSFTTPIYKMSNAVRLLRYPFILVASIWGGLGISVGVVFLLGHLMRLKSFGNPYMLPLFPLRKGGISSTLIRPDYIKSANRPSFIRALSRKRYNPANNKDPKEGLDSE
jgi:spore germination protein KA